MNLTNLVNEDLVFLERKYRAVCQPKHLERLIGMCLSGGCDKMVKELCGISFEDSLYTDDTNPSISTSEGSSKSESLLARMRPVHSRNNI